MPLAQSNPTNEQWGVIAMAIGGAFAGVAAVTMWLDKRAKGILAEGTAELRAEVAVLRKRIEALENGNREARGFIIDAITLLSSEGPGNEAIIIALKKAQGILH